MEKVAASSRVTKAAQPCSPRDMEAHKAHRRIVPLAAFNPPLHLSSLKKNLCIYVYQGLCLFMHGGSLCYNTCVTAWLWRSEGSFQVSVLSYCEAFRGRP